MKALISGSVAFDSIMVFQDRFKHHILPEQVHILNVSFLVPDLRREFGGCAGNIAYNLRLLGDDGVPLATVGADFDKYAAWMDQWGIDRSHVAVLDDAYTGQAYIITDLDDNQITAFHPGAMGRAHEVGVPAGCDAALAVVAPNGPEGMVRHARELNEQGIPFIFDPGQAMPLFDGKALLEFVDRATYVAVNDYESQLLCERTGLSVAQLAERVDAMVVTRGAEGSQIHSEGAVIEIPTAPVRSVEDPTGCGDAYRAGLIHGLMRGLDWPTTGRIAALMGAIKVEHHGTQNHRFTPEQFRARYAEAFGEALDTA